MGSMTDKNSIVHALKARALQRASWVARQLYNEEIDASAVLTEAEAVVRIISALRQIEHEEGLNAQRQAETETAPQA